MESLIEIQEENVYDEDGRLKGFNYIVTCKKDGKVLLEFFESESRAARLLESFADCEHIDTIRWTEYAKDLHEEEFNEDLQKAIYHIPIKSEILLLIPKEGN